MVLATDDVRDPHFIVVDNNRQMVERFVYAARDDKVAELRGVKLHLAAHRVLKRYFCVRVFKSDYFFVGGVCPRFGFICAPAFYEFWNIFLIHFSALRLPRHFRQSIGESEPRKRVYDVILVLFFTALAVGVLKTQHHFSAVVRGKKIVKKRCPHPADMQKPRGAWRKPRNHLLRHLKTIAVLSLLRFAVLNLTIWYRYDMIKRSPLSS